MERVVVPEILDSLPADDPEAVKSRRELRLINLKPAMGSRKNAQGAPKDWIAENGEAPAG